MSVTKSLIVAAAQNSVIGRDNKMLWHIPEDFKYFKAVTMNKPVIMGRKTYESILGYLGKPLPGRKSVVITRQGDYEGQGDTTIVSSVEDAISEAQKVAEEKGLEEIMCIGGAQIYKQFLEHCDRVYLTVVEENFEGDSNFPKLDEQNWTRISTKRGAGTDTLSYRFEVWERQ